MNGTRRSEDTPPEPVPEGSGKQFGDDVADIEEVPEGDEPEGGKGFAKGTPPEPTPDPAAQRPERSDP